MMDKDRVTKNEKILKGKAVGKCRLKYFLHSLHLINGGGYVADIQPLEFKKVFQFASENLQILSDFYKKQNFQQH